MKEAPLGLPTAAGPSSGEVDHVQPSDEMGTCLAHPLGGAHHLGVGHVDEGRAVCGREVVEQFLLAFVHALFTSKPFQVCQSNVGDAPMGGFGDGAEQRDFLLVVRAHFHHHKFRLGWRAQQGQGHPDVVVEVPGSCMNLHPLSQHIAQEFLRRGFSVASRQGQHGTIPRSAHGACRGLQRVQHVFHDRDTRLLQPLSAVAHDMGSSLFQGSFHKVVAVKPFSCQRPKHQASERVTRVRGHALGLLDLVQKAINCGGGGAERGGHGFTSGQRKPPSGMLGG